MDQYISKGKLTEAVYLSMHNNQHKDGVRRACHNNEHIHFVHMIYHMPGEDVVPVVHAKWLGHRGELTCSNCGSEGPEDGGYWASPYCPSCGAKMDLKEI